MKNPMPMAVALLIVAVALFLVAIWLSMRQAHSEQAPPVGVEVRPVIPADGRMTMPRAKFVSPDPLKMAAAKALRGDYGRLREWQRIGWQEVMDQGTYPGQVAWVTNYWTGEPGVGTVCASGRRVEVGRTAAMLHSSGRRLRTGEFGYYVVISLPTGYELRQVWDTGSPRNAARARKKGAETWIDRYVPRRDGRTWIRPIYIVRRVDTRRRSAG